MISFLKVTAEWHRVNGTTLEKQEQSCFPNSCAQTMSSEPWGAQDKAQCAGGTGTLESACSPLSPSLIWAAVPLSWLLSQD